MKYSGIDKILFKTGELVSNFKVEKVTVIEEMRSIAYEMLHKKSGAKLVYISNDDPENLFSVGFRTLPTNDTGVPHILEHTVLCGSKKFPVKDPFVELLKTSMATFLNAMTYPDKTVYPCASMNENDFHNLIEVYCDAVFFPLLREEHFKQEGHHFEIDKKNNLSIDGVVYNEMKGVYSDLDGIISREESRSILPDNTYGKDSGGIPEKIPSLTYGEFVNFHKKFYHPSNSYILVYGSFKINKTLELLDNKFLNNFTKIKPPSGIRKPKTWSEPKRKIVYYPVSKESSCEKASVVTVNFLTNDVTDAVTTLSMSLLENYLLDNAASPLRKALIDSKYGDSLTSSGYADYQKNTFFTVGLKNIKTENTEKVTDLIFDVCRKEIATGIKKDKMESAFHKLALASLEIESSYPLNVMDRVYESWMYGESPIKLLNLNNLINQIRHLYETEHKFFETLLTKYILDNKHYCVLSFVPDNKYEDRLAKTEGKKLKDILKKLNKDEISKIKKESSILRKMQESPNSAEALATLPKLTLKDIAKKSPNWKKDISETESSVIISNNVFANGINYLNMALDISHIPEDLYPYLPLFRSTFLKMGTSEFTYLEMAEKEARLTGGIGSAISIDGHYLNSEKFSPYLTVSIKSLNKNFEEALDLLKERILECSFIDIKRLREVIFQTKTALKSSIISSGSSYALSMSSRVLGKNAFYSESFSGVSYIKNLIKLCENFENNKDELIEKLTFIKKTLLNNNKTIISFIGNSVQEKHLKDWSCDFVKKDNKREISKNIDLPINENTIAITMPSAVSFNALSFKVPQINKETEELFAAITLIAQMLTYGHLWEEIRAKRGAYGVKAGFSILNGIFGFSSYRDPNIASTYEVFDNAFLSELFRNIDSKFIEQSIIGAIKRIDIPIRPEDSCGSTLFSHLRGMSDDIREKFRSNLLSVNKTKILKALELLIEAKNSLLNSRCTLSSQSKINEYNSKHKDNFKLISI